jgi:hypothetical protein
MLSVWRNGCLSNKLEGESSWRRDMAMKGAGGNPGAVTKKGGDGAGGSTGTGRGGGNNARGSKSASKGTDKKNEASGAAPKTKA